MAEQNPLYLAKTTTGDPSAIAEFTSGDTIPSGFMSSSLSATEVVAVTGTFTNLSATEIQVVSSLNVSSNVGLLTSSLSSIEGSASVGGAYAIMPTPPPLMWLRMNTNGTVHVSERKFGHGSTVIGVSSVPDYFLWDDTNDDIYVSAIGIYKITANCLVTVAATLTAKLNLDINSVEVHSVTTQIHGVTDPHMIGLSYVGLIRTDQPVSINRTGDGANAINFDANSTLLIERVG